jgi:Mn2+/Fe2+ NRAMP family transporter
MSNQIETQLEVQLENRNRISALFRGLLVIPPFIFLSAFSNWSSDDTDSATWTLGFLVLPAFLAIVFRGIYPSYVLAFNHAFLNLSLRITAYFALLTDKYPTIEANEVAQTTLPDVEGGAKLNRLLPFVKWFLAIPLYLVGLVYALYGALIILISWLHILFTGNMSANSADIICRVISYWNRVAGYSLILVTDEYPSFKL